MIMNNQNELRTRCKNFLTELEYPVARLAKKIGCARETLHRWKNGSFDFGIEKLNKLDQFLSKYGF